MTKLALLFASFALLVVSGCKSDKDMFCQDESDCGGSLICAQLGGCGSTTCTGVCADPCDTDEDCSNSERCIDEAGSGRGYCRFFEDSETRE